MATRLSHNATVPLWGFCLIIVLGSVVIIGTVFLTLRYYIRHHDSGNDHGSIRSDPEAVRRVTVRRGRVVPHSHYMSLTGSRYGVGADGDEVTLNGRNKSPFEWWNSVHSRSASQMSNVKGSSKSIHSRSNSQMSQVRPFKTVGRVAEAPTAGDTPRKQAPSPLRTAASFESEKPPTYFPFPTRPALAHRPSRTTNFSRPGLGITSPSLASSLPQIMEASPHQSMISARQSKHSFVSEKALSIAASDLGPARSPASMTGFNSKSSSTPEISLTVSENVPFDHHPAVAKPQKRSRLPRPTQNIPLRSKSLPRSPRPANNAFQETVPARRPSAADVGVPRVEITTSQPVDSVSSLPDRRPSTAKSIRRSSSTLNSKSSSNYRGPGDADHITGQLSNESVQALPQINQDESSQSYWESRQDLRPVRKRSQKGKVLRKKSLQRAERTSMVN